MHELGIALEIINIVREESSKRNLHELQEIGIRLGSLSGVDPEALSFSFEAATWDTPLASAKLRIEQIPVGGECRSCGKKLQLDDFVFMCPHCDSTDIDITQGEELDLAYLVEK
jgi:hydrogenase nickel incorporation protein HypA/HybF